MWTQERKQNYINKEQVTSMMKEIEVIDKYSSPEPNENHITVDGDIALVKSGFGQLKYQIAHRTEFALILYQKGCASYRYIRPSYLVYFGACNVYKLHYQIRFASTAKKRALKVAIAQLKPF